MTGRRALALFGSAAAIGIVVFGVMVSRVTSVERVPASAAERRFLAIRDSLALAPPIFEAQGALLVRRPAPDETPTERPRVLHVLAFRHDAQSLVSSAIPFWFLRLKMPALRFVLQETDVDLVRFAIGPEELARYGPSVVYEEAPANGDRVLIWTN